MNIVNAQYVLQTIDGDNNKSIKATIDGAECTCVAPGNRHYDEIQRQVAAGDLTIADAD